MVNVFDFFRRSSYCNYDLGDNFQSWTTPEHYSFYLMKDQTPGPSFQDYYRFECDQSTFQGSTPNSFAPQIPIFPAGLRDAFAPSFNHRVAASAHPFVGFGAKAASVPADAAGLDPDDAAFPPAALPAALPPFELAPPNALMAAPVAVPNINVFDALSNRL
jgi:hypothetical protein